MYYYNPKPGDKLETLDTPAMLVNLDLMEANIQKLVARLKRLNPQLKIRPHFKTIKSPALARILLSVDTMLTGGCVAKVSEAEVMAGEGVEDLLITTEIVGATKIQRLVELVRNHPQTKVVVDSLAGARGLNAAIVGADLSPLQVLIDVNVGQNRTGVPPSQPALELAREIARLPGLRLVGVQGYEGHLQHLHDQSERVERCQTAMARLVGTAQQLREAGFLIDIVTTGGTGTAEICAAYQGVTEVQPGSFIFMDSDYRNALGPVYANALTVLTTVISRADERRAAVIDAGLKSLSIDSGMPELKSGGQGKVSYRPGGDEHGILEWEAGQDAPLLAIGERVEMIPSHIDTTVNLHDFYYAHRAGVIEAIWPVAARGKVQ